MLWDSNKCKFLYVPPRKTVYKRTLSELEKVKKDVVRMRIYTTHRRIAKRLSTNDSGKNVTMSKRRSFLDCGCSLL